LDELGMLRPTLNIGHGNFISDNPNLNYSVHRDLELIGRAGASVSHCPINIVRRARTLDHWQRYQEAGVNMCLGSDTYPRDMIMNMRTASYLGKIIATPISPRLRRTFFAPPRWAGRSRSAATISVASRPARSPTSSSSIYRGEIPCATDRCAIP